MVEIGVGFLIVVVYFVQVIGYYYFYYVWVFFVLVFVDGLVDVVVGQVGYVQWVYGKVEFFDGFVDLLYVGVFFQYQQGFMLVLVDYVVVDEVVVYVGDYGGFFDCFGQFYGGGQYVFGGFFVVYYFQQFYDVGWIEEVQVNDVFWVFGEVGDFVQVQGGGV